MTGQTTPRDIRAFFAGSIIDPGTRALMSSFLSRLLRLNGWRCLDTCTWILDPRTRRTPATEHDFVRALNLPTCSGFRFSAFRR